jgi:hypothetical protein
MSTCAMSDLQKNYPSSAKYIKLQISYKKIHGHIY